MLHSSYIYLLYCAAVVGVVLHSPILSGMRVLTESRALSCLDIYPNVDRIARVRCPVMVMHGMKDEEVRDPRGFPLEGRGGEGME